MPLALRAYKARINLMAMLARLLPAMALAAGLGAPFGASAQDPSALPPPYRRGIDILDYAFIIDLPDTGAVIRGDATLTLRRTARVDTLVLDLRELKVTRVTLEDRPRRYTRDDSTIRISLPRGDTGTFR